MYVCMYVRSSVFLSYPKQPHLHRFLTGCPQHFPWLCSSLQIRQANKKPCSATIFGWTKHQKITTNLLLGPYLSQNPSEWLQNSRAKKHSATELYNTFTITTNWGQRYYSKECHQVAYITQQQQKLLRKCLLFLQVLEHLLHSLFW